MNGLFFYPFSHLALFSGTNERLSLPFFSSRSVFGHDWAPFFTDFPILLCFRARLGSFLYRFYHLALFSGMNESSFFTVFLTLLCFRARMSAFLYRFSHLALFSGTNERLSLPFFPSRSVFGHDWAPFFTVFTISLCFRARMSAFRYHFSHLALFSGTNGRHSLPFFPSRSVFGHEWAPFFTVFTISLCFRARLDAFSYLFY